MAVVAHRVYKDVDPGDIVVDGVTEVILAIDNAVDTSDALIRARAVTVLNAALGSGKFPTGYFTGNEGVAATYDAAGDVCVINGRKVYRAVA